MTGTGTVLVTGSAGGLGGACATYLRQQGYSVIGWDCVESPDGSWQRVDLTSFDEVAAAAAGLPPLAGVVNCAGVSNRLSVAELSAQDFANVVGINLGGTFNLAKAVFPALQAAGGTFVGIGSVAGSAAFTNRAAYCSSKAAVIMLVKCLAIEWAQHGVRAVCVSPGFVDAGMSVQGQREGGTSSTAILDHTPFGRLVKAEEFAQTVAFVISDAASGITGSEILVDAGFDALSGF